MAAGAGLFGGGVSPSFAPSSWADGGPIVERPPFAAMRTLVASTFGDDVPDLDMARPC
ncbi:hypothetical protein K6W26_20485 [Burkholderia sp. AU42008]|uniref:hypothetical protein n=1 Tax=unclassified Burkholderia TaxID=2613784 RepID=UPI0015C59805|nr:MULTISPECIES: hypothetical protein [unclassified Burkholderia]MBR8233435.1 hypothetical protein [Burkholderia sp. AU32357]MBY4875435.1 hypothetical protein [Burkholderia sp. AU42008]